MHVMSERKENVVNKPEIPAALRLTATHDAVSRAHDAELSAALESVRWQRRGLLGRLARDTTD
jgi:hypothetical protein